MLIEYTETFKKWFDKLKNKDVKNKILVRLLRIEATNNLGDYKSLGDGLYEIRINYGSGYRLYFIFKNDKIIIILCGGDKSTQQKDIISAKKILTTNGDNYGNKNI